MKVNLTVIHNQIYLPIPLEAIKHLSTWTNGCEIELDVQLDGQVLVAHTPNSPTTHMKGVREIIKPARNRGEYEDV